jgi:periplasmic protein TonB
MKKILSLIFLLNVISLNAQRVFVDSLKALEVDSVHAKFIRVTEKGIDSFIERYFYLTGEKESEVPFHRLPSTGNFVREGKTTEWFRNGQKKEESIYSNNKTTGKSQQWYESGQLKSDIDLFDGKFDGNLLTFWKNGNPKRSDVFKKDELIRGTCYDSLGNKIKHFDFNIMPEYPGGDERLLIEIAENTKYPYNSRNANIQGRVIVKFVVNADGKVSHVQILQGVNQELDAEAMRVVGQLKKFKPGKIDGEPSPVWYLVPISFSLR